MISDLCLRRRGEDRLIQLGGLDQALRELDAADRAGGLVLLQSGASEVAASHAFEGNHIQLLAHHGAPEHLLGDALVIQRSREVVREVDLLKEVGAHRGEHPPLVWNIGVEHEIVGTDPIRDDHQQVLCVDLVDLADFTRGNVLVIRQFWSHG